MKQLLLLPKTNCTSPPGERIEVAPFSTVGIEYIKQLSGHAAQGISQAAAA